jgi:hypothetical protein
VTRGCERTSWMKLKHPIILFTLAAPKCIMT